MADVLRYTMTAFAEWHYRCGLFAADPRLLPEYDAAVAEEDVRHQGEWPARPILSEPAVVTLAGSRVHSHATSFLEEIVVARGTTDGGLV